MDKVTVDEARNILGNEAKGITDSDLSVQLAQMDELADIFIDIFLKMQKEGRIKIVKTTKGNRMYVKWKALPGKKEHWERLKK
jgi:hypothetical protein